ncbi:RPM1-interacting protein 4-like [Juglans microcarpa x Juglans regia]|uniref:RPM1-interacting protein 4-like n=1 Tax=Juglans microcarpa x Juglans regia TaxID=2249226 RepID=UPI001B7DB48F|nr:RPM1-interacting protein 4-like [Juglans microcarpa x Juglans regia]
MAQHSHSRVPKFGNWESGDISYTSYFKNVRKERTGILRMNPNDPEENPKAVVNADYSIVQAPLHVNSRKSIISPVENNHHVVAGKVRHRGNHRSQLTSKSGSDRSNSNSSLMQHSHRRDRSGKKKSSLAEGISNLSSCYSRHPTRSDSSHHREASVPKFGAWDEADPSSGDGFTVIFNKVKEEKQIASSLYPVNVPQQPSYHSNTQRRGRSSSRSKICCCLFSCGRE